MNQHERKNFDGNKLLLNIVDPEIGSLSWGFSHHQDKNVILDSWHQQQGETSSPKPTEC